MSANSGSEMISLVLSDRDEPRPTAFGADKVPVPWSFLSTIRGGVLNVRMLRLMLVDKAVSPEARTLAGLLLIHDFGREKTGKSWPGRKRLAALMNCGKDKITALIQELESAGYIYVERHQYSNRNHYYQTFPAFDSVEQLVKSYWKTIAWINLDHRDFYYGPDNEALREDVALFCKTVIALRKKHSELDGTKAFVELAFDSYIEAKEAQMQAETEGKAENG